MNEADYNRFYWREQERTGKRICLAAENAKKSILRQRNAYAHTSAYADVNQKNGGFTLANRGKKDESKKCILDADLKMKGKYDLHFE